MYSWPAIIVGFLLCIIPGFILLWRRPDTPLRTKWIVTGIAALVMAFGAVNGSANPPASDSLATDIGTSVQPTDTPVSSPPSPTSPAHSASPSSRPSAHPSSSLAPPTSPTQASSHTALGAAENLPVKGRAPRTGYSRAEFGPAWFDTDGNGCDTRDDMLRKYLHNAVFEGSCIVLSGTLNDPYTGKPVNYVRGGYDEVDVDHMVSLSDAWQTGAQYWPAEKRLALANDPLNLQPTAAWVNRQKSDSDAASWLPSNKAYRCEFVARQVAVKQKYRLWVTASEQAAMVSVLQRCASLALPAPGPNPTLAA
jgi:hypothetical protein